MVRTMAETATKLTYDDFLLFPDDGMRHELIDGEHYVSPSPNLRHQRLLARLNLLVANFAVERRLGEVFFAPFDVVFTRHDVVEPDLLFVSNERKAILTAPNVQGAPDLVVEVLSPSNRRQDEVVKRSLYDRGGVSEYWIVDPDVETIKVFRRGEGTFGRALLLSAHDGDKLVSPLFPGLEIPLAALFAE
ncbi:MAG TPA: Uma2 family endonuclease [Thermoanaerobaculia bacterium]|nr:Uma2 family endonuclease [Thermoanaerobaculia bacterium]